MEKFYFICYLKAEEEKMVEELKSYGDKIKDYQLSKAFDVQGQSICGCVLVTDEETFGKITENLNADRLY